MAEEKEIEQPVSLHVKIKDKEIGTYTQITHFENVDSLIDYLIIVTAEQKLKSLKCKTR